MYRLQQSLKSAISSRDGAVEVQNSWSFQHQGQRLASLSYDQHLQALQELLPNYQDQIREDLVLYRKWLLREIKDEEVSWVRSAVSGEVMSKTEFTEVFESALLRQVNLSFQAKARLPTPTDYTQALQNSSALRFFQIINPLQDEVYEEHKSFAVLYKMLTFLHRHQIRTHLRAREDAVLASPHRSADLPPVCE